MVGSTLQEAWQTSIRRVASSPDLSLERAAGFSVFGHRDTIVAAGVHNNGCGKFRSSMDMFGGFDCIRVQVPTAESIYLKPQPLFLV